MLYICKRVLELSKQYFDDVVTFLQITKMQDDKLILKPLQMQHDTLCNIHSLNVVQKPQQT